jgi:hypothetical protein
MKKENGFLGFFSALILLTALAGPMTAFSDDEMTNESESANPRMVRGDGQVRGPRGYLGAQAVARANAVQQCQSEVVQASPWSLSSDFGPVFMASAIFRCAQ